MSHPSPDLPQPVAAIPRPTVLALSIPVAMGYIPLGMVFGFLFVQAGAPWWLALVASIIVFAGAAQFMMVPMLAAGLPLASIALAALFAVLAIEQWRNASSSAPLWVALLSYALAYMLWPAQALLIAIALCVLAGMVSAPPEPTGKATIEPANDAPPKARP